MYTMDKITLGINGGGIQQPHIAMALQVGCGYI